MAWKEGDVLDVVAVTQKTAAMTVSRGTMNGHNHVHNMAQGGLEGEDLTKAEIAEVGDEEDEAQSIPLVRQRHQQGKLAFEDWYQKKAATTDVSKVKVSRKSEQEEIQSLQDMLLKQQEGRMIIGSERAYQIELFERAKERNTIAVLDTGSGKTLIAVLLLKYVLEREIEYRAAGKPKKLAFFLVDKVTLLLQQYAVLTANLRFKIERLCGEMGIDIWTAKQWQKTKASTDVMVCTADVLLTALMRSFVTIEEINLLIFDEVHHAKKDHAYAKICREHYNEHSDIMKRPRIFGMTASPFDVEAIEDDIDAQLKELETMTHSQIATTDDGGQLKGFVHRPDEERLLYARPQPRFDTRLYQSLTSKYYDLAHFKSLFKNAKTTKSELGPWCSDMYWSFAFTEKEAKKAEGRIGRDGKKTQPLMDEKSAQIDSEQIEQLRQAHLDIMEHDFGPARPTLEDLSDKVLELHRCLALHFERPSDTRCLVFVNERVTARLLRAVFEHIGSWHLKPGVLLGSTANTLEGIKFTFKQQFETLMKFKKGELNCLFATTVAEEGLDVPDCNLVIRFDLCKTMIQYIQSRGRARHQNSRMYHLLERDNTEQEDRLDDILDSEKRMRTFFKSLPKDRLLYGDKDADDGDAEDTPRFRSIVYKKAGAKLTYAFSLVVLHNFVDNLMRDEGEDCEMVLNWHHFLENGQFKCEVSLPDRAMIPSVIGHGYRRKHWAKMSAAFEACKLLKKHKLLDDNLLPIYTKKMHVMGQARLAVTSKKQLQYPCQRKPSLWAEGRGTIPESLYLTILLMPDGWDRPIRTMGLLTRMPLAELPSFPLFRRDGQRSDVHLVASSHPINVTPKQVSQLTWFALTLWKDLYNKTYEDNDAQMSYWLAPLNATHSCNAGYEVDWEMLASIDRLGTEKWNARFDPGSLAGRFFVDPYDGGRRMYTQKLRPDMDMNDALPEGCVPGPRGAQVIIDYSCSLWRKSRERRSWEEGQPVIEAEAIVHRLNISSEPSEAEQKAKTKCYVCPEPLDISRLPADLAAMGYLYPAIIHRVESYLIALEFAQELQLNVKPALALEAVTKDSDNSDDADAEKINFQRGMGPNYERLEFIGDCFLKMATTISTFIHNASNDEFYMHVERMLLLCNANLYNNAKNRGYPRYVRSIAFSRQDPLMRTWYPEAIKLLQGKGANKTDAETSPTQGLGDKTVADVCEAMIGAALISNVETGYCDTKCFDDAVKAVTAFAWSEANPAHDMQRWSDYYKLYKLPAYQTSQSTAVDLDAANQVQEAHNYAFQHPKLLQSAFTHPSVPRSWASVPNYQRLEFLGDSLLDMTADFYLFKKYPRKDPQWLTEHKEAMVSNKFLGALAASLGFNKYLNHNDAAVEGQMTAFIKEYKEAEADANGARDFWTGLRDPPKCLADMVEAFVGAMFIDSRFNYAEVQRFFDEHILYFFEDMTVYDTFANNSPMNHLRDILETSLGCTNWSIKSKELLSDDEQSSVTLAAVVVHGNVIGEGGVAKTGRVAKVYAAKAAAEMLEGIAPFEFRRERGCDCSGVTQTKDEDGVDEAYMGTAI